MRFVFPISLLILITIFPLFAQEKATPEKELALSLIKAESEQERTHLLAANKKLVTVELRTALLDEGDKLRVQSDFPKALYVFNLTKQIAEQIGDKAGVGHSLRAIGTIYAAQGNESLALDFFQQSFAIAEEVSDKALIASSLRSIGVVEEHRGNIDIALENYQKSLVIAEQLQDKTLIAAILNNFGVLHTDQGNFRVGMDYMERALKLRYELRNTELIASSLNNIAILHDFQGNYAQALEYYRKSLKLREELGDKANIANVMNNMGDYRLLGDYELALQYNKKSLAIAEELGDRRLMARALGNIGNKYRQMGEYDRALEFFLRSFALAEELDYKETMANHLRNLANIYYEKADYDESLKYAERAITIARQIGSRKDLWTGLEARGRAYRALKQTEKAKQDFEEAIATIENWRYLVAGGELEQQSLFAEKVSPYHEMIDLLISQKLTEEALEYAERAKARVLLDVLRSGRVKLTGAMSAEERQLEQKWNRELISINKQIQSATMTSTPDQELLENLNSKLQQSRLEWEAFRTKLYTAHPELKVKRGEAEPLNMENAQTLLPDSQTAFLEYVVTEEDIFLFVLTKHNPPSVFKIDTQQSTLSEKIKDFRSKIANRDPNFRKLSIELFDLLIGPAAKELEEKSKLAIIPDDVLWELPFQALLSPKNLYLLEEKTLSFIPSLTVLREMMYLENKRMNSTPANILAFGNPALGKNTLDQLKSIFRDSNLNPLPEAEKEAKKLGQLYGEQLSKVYIRADAQESRFKTEASQFRILHLATHGILNDSAPMYSQIVLAQTGTGEEEDGLLEAREILNMNLNADLVVLSSCESALGKVGQGEGMMGLAWAFFVAGTSTTVVSQWKVASASTTEFMLTFHQKLKSESKAEALRSAALQLSKQDQYRHPFYWAPFVLIGNGI